MDVLMRASEIYEQENNLESYKQILEKEVPLSFKNLLNGRVFWKGFRGDISEKDFFQTDPKQRLRKSVNTENYYTLIMDNSKEWNSFPDRSRSLICATSQKLASENGYAKVVLPKNNAVLGVCSEHDLWDSFPYFMEKINEKPPAGFRPVLDISDMNRALKSYARKAYTELNDDDFNRFVEGLKEIDQAYSNEDIGDPYGLYFKEQPLLENLKELLDPNKNGFKIMNLNELYNSNIINESREVWTDAESYIVDEMLAEEIAKNYGGVSIIDN